MLCILEQTNDPSNQDKRAKLCEYRKQNDGAIVRKVSDPERCGFQDDWPNNTSACITLST